LQQNAGITVLKGNIAPNGAVIKPSAATTKLLKHRGPAVVFETIEEFKAKVDLPEMNITPDSVLVLKGAGPRGYPGMPEVGNLPLPKKLLQSGVKDMVRISDARMSGTAFGTVVLHISPESAVGGPLALIQTGDPIELDAQNQKLNVLISQQELDTRKKSWKPPKIPEVYQRGYGKLYLDHVTQAHTGADLDFLVGKSGSPVPRENH